MGVPSVETIVDGLEPIALIIRAGFDEPGIHFFTPSSFSQQVAVMRHPAGKKIAAHVHNAVSRQVLYTTGGVVGPPRQGPCEPLQLTA